MILMRVSPVMGKNQIRRSAFESFEALFDLGSLKGEKAIVEIVDDDFPSFSLLQEELGARSGFPGARSARTEDNPGDFRGVVSQQA